MELPLWKVLVLAIIQGITEFLPISSDGHLVVANALLSPDEPDVLDLSIALHLGTLGSILIVYFRRVARLLTEDRRLIGLLVVATLPAVAVGLPVKLFFEDVLENPLVAGWGLIVTGVILLFSWWGRGAVDEKREIGYLHALYMGIAQAIAILPGVSRSGTTITTGVRLGYSPKNAATFSFLMAIPAIGGAGVLQAYSLIKDSYGAATTSTATAPIVLVIGALVAFVVGYAALQVLLRLLERGRFHWFAGWCIPVGIAVVIWQLSK